MNMTRPFQLLSGTGFLVSVVIVMGLTRPRTPGVTSTEPAEGAPVVTGAAVADAVDQMKISEGYLRSWLPRPDLERKTVGEVLSMYGRRFEDMIPDWSPPGALHSWRFPVHENGSTVWVTLGVTHYFLNESTPEYMDEAKLAEVEWAVETPREPHMSDQENFPGWVDRLRKAEQARSSPERGR